MTENQKIMIFFRFFCFYFFKIKYLDDYLLPTAGLEDDRDTVCENEIRRIPARWRQPTSTSSWSPTSTEVLSTFSVSRARALAADPHAQQPLCLLAF